MTRHMNLPPAAVLRWQIPDLDAPPEPPHVAAQDEPAADAAVVEPMPEAHSEADGAADERAAIAEAIEREIAKGYAEGLERGLDEGREKGYADGFAAGAKAGEASLAQQAHRVAGVLQRLVAPIPALERSVEEAVVALALEVARCVIGSEVSRSREYLVRLIREALAKAPVPMHDLRIMLNPADLEIVRGLAPELESGGATLLGEAAVEPGGCVVALDAETRLKDRRWQPRAGDGASQVDLSLAGRWRNVMLNLFDGEGR